MSFVGRSTNPTHPGLTPSPNPIPRHVLTPHTDYSGDAIALYGPSGAEAAQVYSVQVDNRTAQSFTAAKFGNQPFRPKELMYFGGNLGAGQHELVVTLNSVSSAQQFLAIDYAEIFTAPSIGGSGCSARSEGGVSAGPRYVGIHLER